MRNRTMRMAVLAGFAAVAVFAGLAVHAAANALGSRGISLGQMTVDDGHGYTTGFYLVVLVALAVAGAFSTAALYLSHGRRAARVRVRSSDRDLRGVRPDDWRRD